MNHRSDIDHDAEELRDEELALEITQALEGEGDLWHALDGCFARQAAPRPSEHPFRAAVVAHLRGAPVAAARLERWPRLALIGLAVALTAILTFAHGLRPDLGEQPLLLLLVPLIVFAGGFFAGGWTFDSHRGGLADLAAPAAVVGIFLAAVSLFEPTASTLQPHSALGPIIGCAVYGVVVASLVLIPAVFVARRSMAGPTRFGAALLGLLAAGLAVGSLHVGCGVVDPVHLLLGHGLVFALGVSCALGFRRIRRFS